MADQADDGDLAGERNRGLRSSQESDRSGAASSSDKRFPGHFDVDSYSMMVYRASINLDTADAQKEYDASPELRHLLAQATATSTVRRRRDRRAQRSEVDSSR
jgi:hypothetical protein